MALPSLANLSNGQKALGIGIVAITGLALIGQGKPFKSKKKKLPSGGKADYMKSLGGGGGGGGGGGAKKKGTSATTTTQDTSTQIEQTDTVPLDPGLMSAIIETQEDIEDDPTLLDFFNYGVPEEEQISTQEEAMTQLEQLQEEYPDTIIEYTEEEGLNIDLFPNWDGPAWFNPLTAVGVQNLDESDIITDSEVTSDSGRWNFDWQAVLQQNIADGDAFGWLDDDSGLDRSIQQTIANNEASQDSVIDATNGWLQQYTNDEEIELEETDTSSSDSGLDWSIQQTIADNEAAQEDSTPATVTLSPSSSGYGYAL